MVFTGVPYEKIGLVEAWGVRALGGATDADEDFDAASVCTLRRSGTLCHIEKVLTKTRCGYLNKKLRFYGEKTE